MATDTIVKKPNMFTSMYRIIQSVLRFLYKIIEYLATAVFAISDYGITFGSYLLSTSFLEKAPFPKILFYYAFVIIRNALVLYGLIALFQLIFLHQTRSMFTRSNTTNCSGNVSGTVGEDKQPLCQTAVFSGKNSIYGGDLTFQYDYDQVNKANTICLKQFIYWFIFLTIFAIPISITTI